MSRKRDAFRKSLKVVPKYYKKPYAREHTENQLPGISPGPGNKVIKRTQGIQLMMKEMAENIYNSYKEEIKKGVPLALICVDDGAKGMYNILFDELKRKRVNLFEGHVKTIKDATRTKAERKEPELSYTSGVVNDAKTLSIANVIIFDDQIVSGKTAALLIEYFEDKAKKVEFATVALTGKEYLQQKKIRNIRFVGMVSKQKVAGYGMDDSGNLRQIRGVVPCRKSGRYTNKKHDKYEKTPKSPER